MIKNEISKHEISITEGIKRDQNMNAQLWDNIKKLKEKALSVGK